MEFHQNPVYSLSSFQDFAAHQDPEEAALVSTADPWEEMVLNENGWDTYPPVDLEPAVPHFIEVPRVPQIPTLYAPPESPSLYPDQQPVNLHELKC